TEAFYMVDKSRSRKQHGAGIGLALAEKIAQIHGSTLEFESDGVSGTTVSICFKCKGAADDE
ncbi:MAG: sensor histidine kinase, partial [Lachnospiraceae bacterium]|nr:sensor histidine kinase [Lachnospiraceae bacterium]